jgi:hypothetical protein
MSISGYQNAGQNKKMKIADGSFGNAAKLKYLGITVAKQNSIR